MAAFQRIAGCAGLALVIAAGLAAAARLPYVLALAVAAAGVGLIVGAAVLARRRLGEAVDALAASAGTVATEREEPDGKRWFGERGFSDLAGQPVGRMRVRAVELATGTVAFIDTRIGPGHKAMVYRAAVWTAPVRAPGAISLYTNNMGGRIRAKLLGGTVPAGSPPDERFIAFSADPSQAMAASGAVSFDAVDALFGRLRRLRAPQTGFAVGSGRASLLAESPSHRVFDPAVSREILDALAACAGRP